MGKPLTNILVNSVLAFVSAFIFTTIFHEFGHYCSYRFFGLNPTLFHNFVQASHMNLSNNGIIIIALMGPFFSLIQGIVFGFILNKRTSTIQLFILWLSLLGFVNFFGYIAMTPFTTLGDTGRVAEILNIDFTLKIIISLFGLFILLLVILKVAKNFTNFIPIQTDRILKARYLYRLMFFPIIIGSIINAFLAFPVVNVLSVIYPATSPFVIMSSFPAILKFSNHNKTKPEFENRIMKSLIILTTCAIIVNRLLTLGMG